MIDEIRQFVLDSLTDMNYSIEGIDEPTDADWRWPSALLV